LKILHHQTQRRRQRRKKMMKRRKRMKKMKQTMTALERESMEREADVLQQMLSVKERLTMEAKTTQRPKRSVDDLQRCTHQWKLGSILF
jgi:hypothetical protein